jgi:hypothetical protein
LTGPVNTWMDLRCMEAAYKDDMLTVVYSAINTGSVLLQEAHNEMEGFLEAQERGLRELGGKDVAVQVALYTDALVSLPDQLRRLNKVYNLLENTPTCEEAAAHRIAEELKAEIPRKGKGTKQRSMPDLTPPSNFEFDVLDLEGDAGWG